MVSQFAALNVTALQTKEMKFLISEGGGFASDLMEKTCRRLEVSETNLTKEREGGLMPNMISAYKVLEETRKGLEIKVGELEKKLAVSEQPREHQFAIISSYQTDLKECQKKQEESEARSNTEHMKVKSYELELRICRKNLAESQEMGRKATEAVAGLGNKLDKTLGRLRNRMEAHEDRLDSIEACI